MSAIKTLLVLVTCQCCLAGDDTNVIAIGDWSKSVGTSDGQSLRGRMLVTQASLPGLETKVYLELQNVSVAAGAPMQVYFDPRQGLHCEVLDGQNKPPPQQGGGANGGGASACSVTLPYDSMIRLRANMYGHGYGEGHSLYIQMCNAQHWVIDRTDTNVYFMSGTFTVRPPTNHITSGLDEARAMWSGTLEFPKMKIWPAKR
jgi:hypothetical protein